MPLSEPAQRRHVHTRRYDFQGFERADGLWDIESRLTDVKTYPFENRHRGCIEPDEPLHDMRIRLTLDDDFLVRDIEAETAAAPFQVCPEIAPAFKRMVGVRIGRGWRQEIKSRLGGVEGCTHLTEMLAAMATVAFQTIYPLLDKRRASTDGGETSGEATRPPLIDSCHALRSDGEVVRTIWPTFFTGDRAAGTEL
jgi:hypothetical protein